MKIGEEGRKDSNGKTIGHMFGWFGEYALDGIWMEDVRYGTENDENGCCPIGWIETDQKAYEGVIAAAIANKILVDVFISVPLKDLFISYLKQYIQSHNIDEEYKKQLTDWYLSNKPGYKILTYYY